MMTAARGDEDTTTRIFRRKTGDRRRWDRLPITIPARIDTEARPQRFGMTRNLSRTGALLATPSRFRIGDRAVLVLRTGGETGSHEVEARIVRLEVNDRDEVGIWRFLMAVRFSSPLPEELLGNPGQDQDD